MYEVKNAGNQEVGLEVLLTVQVGNYHHLLLWTVALHWHLPATVLWLLPFWDCYAPPGFLAKLLFCPT